MLSYNKIHVSGKFTYIKRLFDKMKPIFCMELWENLQKSVHALQLIYQKYFWLDFTFMDFSSIFSCVWGGDEENLPVKFA